MDAKKKRRGVAQKNGDALDDDERAYCQLVAAAAGNAYRFFNVEEIRILFKLPKATMAELRAIASRDPLTDPWRGTITSPQKFAEWFWTVRPRLEHPELNATQLNGKNPSN